MTYKILKFVSSNYSNKNSFWQYVMDENNEEFKTESLEELEYKIKELSTTMPINVTRLRIVNEIGYDSDFIFETNEEPLWYDYEVNYYFNDVRDNTKSLTGRLMANTLVVLVDYSSNNYELDITKTPEFPNVFTISTIIEDNVLNIYYKSI